MMWIAAIVVLAIVAAACLRLAHEQRSLAERAVDALYRTAACAYALAVAADASLVKYRAVRQEIRSTHIPAYCSEER